MVTKSKLKLALAAEKGTDFRKIKEKRKAKAARKEKEKKKQKSSSSRQAAAAEDEGAEDVWEDESVEGDEDEDAEELGNGLLDLEVEESDSEDDEEASFNAGALGDSESSDSEVEIEEKIARPKATPREAKDRRTKTPESKTPKGGGDGDDGDSDADEDEEDIPMSDLEDLPDEDKDDLIRHQRLTINNTSALLASLKRIALSTDAGVPFSSHMCVVSSAPTEADIPDVADDLNRELALYKQSLEAAKKARALLRAEGVPFSRPNDYFAEMVKADDHMEKVRAKLVEDATAKKASAEARKLRDMKKFGKQVQIAKMQERNKAKKDTLEKIQSLKRKRQESSSELPAREADLFDVAAENELRGHKGGSGGAKGGSGGAKGGRGAGASGARGAGEPGRKRQKKNEKFGYGGRKRNSKSGDAMSAGDLSGFSVSRNRGKTSFGKAPRPGKSKRQAAAARR